MALGDHLLRLCLDIKVLKVTSTKKEGQTRHSRLLVTVPVLSRLRGGLGAEMAARQTHLQMKQQEEKENIRMMHAMRSESFQKVRNTHSISRGCRQPCFAVFFAR